MASPVGEMTPVWPGVPLGAQLPPTAAGAVVAVALKMGSKAKQASAVRAVPPPGNNGVQVEVPKLRYAAWQETPFGSEQWQPVTSH